MAKGTACVVPRQGLPVVRATLRGPAYAQYQALQDLIQVYIHARDAQADLPPNCPTLTEATDDVLRAVHAARSTRIPHERATMPPEDHTQNPPSPCQTPGSRQTQRCALGWVVA